MGATPVVGTPGITAVPAGAVVVDDLPSSSTNLAGCATVSSSGTFSLAYGQDASGDPNGAIDTHQIGVGYMGHSYFSHTVDQSRANVLATGTWTPPSTVTGWQRIWVHIPDNGADTYLADYKIYTGTQNLHRVVNQRWNKKVWFDLGSFQLSAGAKVTLSNATHTDFDPRFGAVDVSWDALAFTPSAKPALSYVALGDSYQAGEGLEPYYANTDVGKGALRTNSCHRSSQAYPNLVFNDLKVAHPGHPELHFAACSGAITTDVLSASLGGTTHSDEVPQLDAGWLDVNTTHVTIGIGGNDARFSDILAVCVVNTHTCVHPSYYLGGDPEPLVQWEPKVIDGLSGTFRIIFDSIRQLAPNAQIAVVGYPHVVTTDQGQRRFTFDCDALDQQEIDFFVQTGDYLNSVLGTAASNAGVSFVNPVAVFAGPPGHEACAADTTVEWINAAVAPSSTGSGDTFPKPGSGSFHPKTTGHEANRNLLKVTLQ